MKVYIKYLIALIALIFIITIFSFYYMNKKNESFTQEEEQIIIAQLLAKNGGFIPNVINQDEVSEYKYKNNSTGINVNDMPLSAQRLTNPLCFNDVIHSQPYLTTITNNLKPDIFAKDESPTMQELIKVNEQLKNSNEQLLSLARKGELDENQEEKRNQQYKMMQNEIDKYYKDVASLNTNIQGNTALLGYTEPTYSSIYEEKTIKPIYTNCIKKGYPLDYCAKMFGDQYYTPPTKKQLQLF